jgi:muramoyltetrapeptide carboxypeptidase
MIQPSNLSKGDKIGIVSVARKISADEIAYSIDVLKQWGYEPVIGKTIGLAADQFAGTDQERAADLQVMLNDPSVRAVLLARGGYGAVRVVDLIDWEALKSDPKWIIGYSDATVLHNTLTNAGIESIHATMPINFETNTPESLDLLQQTLAGGDLVYEWETQEFGRIGQGEGQVVGGNLSVLYSILGSSSFPQLNGRILFLEDLDEYLYHIDRMMMGLKRSGTLENLSGLLVGGMTAMNDNEVPFGKDAEAIIHEHTASFSYPVAFGFAAGHMDQNFPLIMGREATLLVDEQTSEHRRDSISYRIHVDSAVH